VIRILADENLPSASVAVLRAAGVDVIAVADVDPGTADINVLERARSEGRALITFDRDFGELIYQKSYPSPPAVIFLRFVPSTPEEPATVLLQLLAHPAIELADRFTVVTRDQVRQRALPQRGES